MVDSVFGLVSRLLKSRLLSTATLTGMATGAYVADRDRRRYPRMVHKFSTGCILEPMANNRNEILYFPRPAVEKQVMELLSPRFSNEYYLIVGDVGSGKTRLLKEVVQRMMQSTGHQGQGAPIYVLASQGINMVESLAKAVDFRFDEYIQLKYLMNYMLRIQSFPSRDEHHKLHRLLSAIEQAAHRYAQEYGKPVVIVIDGANRIAKHEPKAMQKLQEKAKLWADTNIVKMVFVSSDQESEEMLQNNVDLWSRAARPIRIGDLFPDEAKDFLMQATKPGCQGVHAKEAMPANHAEKIVNLIGGRMYHLLVFVYDWSQGIPIEATIKDLRNKEFVKFYNLKKSSATWEFLRKLQKTKDGALPLSNAVGSFSNKAIDNLTANQIVAFEKKKGVLYITFDNKLTKVIADELCSVSK